MQALPHTGSCFVCGESNASGLRLRFETDGRAVLTRFQARGDHVGFKGTIHGGIIATVLDEIMVWACAVQTQRFAYCAELSVRFASPLRPGQEVFASGEMVSNRRNKLFEAKSELRSESGVVLATGSGKYLPVKESEIAEMLTDFRGEPGDLFDPLARQA
jgi:acyl-coenzyme A thioesterase PaaI-like protein